MPPSTAPQAITSTDTTSKSSSSLFTPAKIFLASILLRISLLLFGIFQDVYSPLPYTDIDYFVFTDAARYVAQGKSPYLRETYRYTPLLAWGLVPTTWSWGPQWMKGWWWHSGKVMFCIADLAAGWVVYRILKGDANPTEHGTGKDQNSKTRTRPAGRGGMDTARALKFASIWLLNPFVATISTRGSSEGLLGLLSAYLLLFALQQRTLLAGIITGLAVHLKIYPFIYGISILFYLPSASVSTASPSLIQKVLSFPTRARLTFTISALLTFTLLNALMYTLYGFPFLQHTFLHHLTRIDHRHNFSVYNTLLHYSSIHATGREPLPALSGFRFERWAFVPQILLSAVLLPVGLARRDLAGAMLCQTWAFVAFNKVVTSQYFLWYMIFLPFYLPYSSFLSSPKLGLTAAALWVGTQALWLHQAYALEFLGQSTFYPGLFVAGLSFFGVNCWILGVMIGDVGGRGNGGGRGERDVVVEKKRDGKERKRNVK